MKQINSLILIVIISIIWSTNLNAQNRIDNKTLPPSLLNRFNYSKVDTYFQNFSKSQFDFSSESPKAPTKIGFSLTSEIKSSSNGSLVKWSSGNQSWMIRISVPEAPALGLVFENVNFPPNSRLFVYSEDNPSDFYSISTDDIFNGFISTPPIVSESIIVEYVEPLTTRSPRIRGTFDISDIVIIYRGIPNLHQEKGIDDSESCHVNINCSPEGDGWKTTKRGVAKLYFREGSSWYVCSGTLVNNAKNDGKPYFLTADHCGGTASINDRSVWQFHFNFERPSCDNNSTPTYNVLTGCTLKARGPLSGGSDFQLLELSSIPPLSWFPYYNGWDRNTNGATSGVSIHHPQGDIKKISTYTESLTSSTPTIDGLRMADNSAWRVYWKATTNGHGVTEGGSSGSPIFNANRQVVGTLSGGGASCSSLTSPDYYGKFSYHWASNGTTNPNKLQPWLDPDNSNITSLNGYDPNGTLYANFEANKTSANTGEQITFTDISTGTSITSWAWTFGEGATPVTATGKGPHTVTYSTGGLKTVSLTINGTTTTTKQGFINILDVPSNTVLYEGFEGAIFPPTGWLNVDSDGDSHKWFAYGAEASAHSGFKCTGSASWDEDTEKALTPNNWLITPQIDITHNNFILEYWVGAQDNDWPKEKYGVFVSKTNTSTTSFVQVFSETLSNDVWNKRQIDLSSYVGEKIYIAFCHFDCTDMFILKIDDVLVTGGATNNSNILDDTAYQIFPNPFGNTLTFKNTSNVNTILIKNVIGSTVKIIKPNGCDEVEVTTSALSSGLYFVVMELHNHERLVKKIIKH